MDRLHAKYPFLESARDAVEAAEVDLEELTAQEPAIVQRARDRVEAALSTGSIGEPASRPRVELLSYPVARALVSVLDEPMAIPTYAGAEAATARERFATDLAAEDGPRTTRDSRITLDRLLTELDLGGVLHATADGYRMAVCHYLRLTGERDEDRWSLVNRSLYDGTVGLDEAELSTVLETAVAERVAAGLPHPVPDELTEALAEEVTALEDLLSSHEVELAFDTVVPALFPPCLAALVERARSGDTLSHHATFTLVTFLGVCSLDADEIDAFTDGGLDRETIEYQLAHLRGERGVEYVPPSCATMQAYGDCVNRDERCDRITHPVAYYERALEDEGEQFPEWQS